MICVVNKVDRLGKGETVQVLDQAARLEGVTEVFPISARTGQGLDALIARLGELVPEGPYLYPPEDRSDQASEVLLAELIREQVLNRTRDEIPHSVEVKIGEVSARADGMHMVTAEIWAESESQKGILIGAGGREGPGDRDRGAARAGAGAGRAGAPRPDRPREAALAPRRGAAGPPRHRLSTKTLNSGDGLCPLRSR